MKLTQINVETYLIVYGLLKICCNTREDLSIDVSITNVGLILTKLGRFQHLNRSQNTNQNSAFLQFRDAWIFRYISVKSKMVQLTEVSRRRDVQMAAFLGTELLRRFATGRGRAARRAANRWLARACAIR